MRPNFAEFGFHRYLLSLSQGGKVLETLWFEKYLDAEMARADYEEAFDVSVSDFACFDSLTGYSAFREAQALMAAYPNAVYCLTTKKPYKSVYAASKATGDTIFYIKQSCRMYKPAPSGRLWRKLKD